MKKTTLIALIVLCAIAGVAGWLVRQKTQQTWQLTALDKKLLPDLPVAKIDRILIRTINDEVEVKKEPAGWVVASSHGFPADQAKVRDLLLKCRDLTAVQRIPVGESDLGRLELNEPDLGKSNTGMELMLIEGPRDHARLRLGKEHFPASSEPAGPWGGGPMASGRYLMMPDRQDGVYLVSETFSRLTDHSRDWLDKSENSFIRIGDAREIVALEGGKALWTLTRESAGGALALAGELPEGKELDTAKANPVGALFSHPTFNRVAPAAQAAQFGLQSPQRTFRMRTFAGYLYTFSIGERTEQGDTPVTVTVDYVEPPAVEAPAEESEEEQAAREARETAVREAAEANAQAMQERLAKWIFFLPNSTTDRMLQQRQDFLKAKAEEPTPDEEDDMQELDAVIVTPPAEPPPLDQDDVDGVVEDE